MNEKIFRKGIIDRLSNPEQLDKTLSIIKPYHWGILLSFGILFIGVTIWSFVGSIPEKANGTGYIMPSDGYISIHYGENATVKNVFVNPGDVVSRGTIIARMERQDVLKQLNLAQQKVDDAEKIYMQSFDNADTVNEISKKYQDGTASDTKAQIRNIEIQIEDFDEVAEALSELCATVYNSSYDRERIKDHLNSVKTHLWSIIGDVCENSSTFINESKFTQLKDITL